MSGTKPTLRLGSATTGDAILMLLGALLALAGLTFFKIRSLDRIEGKVHHPGLRDEVVSGGVKSTSQTFQTTKQGGQRNEHKQ